MSYRNKNIAVLDIGSSKVCCMIVSKDENDISKVMGLGYKASSGIHSGIITDINLATGCISDAIRLAEKQSNISIKDGLTVSISSSKIFTKRIKSSVAIKEKNISTIHIDQCLSSILNDNFFLNKKIINASPVNISIDGAIGIKNPYGMYGDLLEIEFIVAYLSASHFKNYIECITRCDVDVNNLVIASQAAGLSVLNEDELKMGSVVIDMGARTTSLGIFSDNKFIFSAVLDFGGSDVSEAIARKFSITYGEAEKLKVMHSSVIESSSDHEIIFEIPSINFENTDDYIQISKRDIYEVVNPIMLEIISWIKTTLNNSGYEKLIGKVIVFTGGASQLDGLSVIAKDILNYNSRIGVAKDLNYDFHSTFDASYSVAAGLVDKEHSIHINNNEQSTSKNQNRTKKKHFSFFRSWVAENFF